MNTPTPTPIETAAATANPDARAAWMGLLARARAAELLALLEPLALPGFTPLRGPEVGLVMVRGRAGGGGAPFNLGEMTATRTTVRDATGRIGHATIAGRNEAHALAAARLDAALQDPSRHAALHGAILAPLAAAEAARRATRARRAAATRVDFFSLATQRS